MSMFYFSGIEKKATAQTLVQERAAGMMSQLLYSSTLLHACEDIPLVLDSGAYSKVLTKEDIQKYAQLIEHLGERCNWYANADCIGDQERSNENYSYLLSLLPSHLHKRVLWIYQYGSDLRYLYEALQQHRQIGVGGLVPILKANDKIQAKHKVLFLANIIASAGCVPHYFGLSSPDIIKSLHAFHADFSVDSTTWLVGAMYGLLVATSGKQRPANEGGYDFSTPAILGQNIRTMRKWVERPSRKSVCSPYTQMTFLDDIA